MDQRQQIAMFTNRKYNNRGKRKLKQPALNILKPWVYERLSKTKAHCERMLQLDCLLDLYKCMENDCSFSTSCSNKMAEHTRHHPMARFSPCAYCSEWLQYEAMIGHVDQEHGSSKFQCRHCFYRAFDAYCVLVHQRHYHPGSIDGDILDILPDDANARRMKLKYDVCSRFTTFFKSLECIDCKHQMLTFTAYSEHIKHIAGPMVRCQICRKTVFKENIYQHLLLHNIGIFECIYCSHAVMDKEELALHISDIHPSKPMNYISRIRDATSPEYFEKYRNVLKSMDFDVFTKKVHLEHEETQKKNSSHQFPSNVEICDTEEDTMAEVDPLSLDESIKSLSTPANIESAVVSAPSRPTVRKEPMMPVIVKVQGGVKFSANGDIIGDSESITTPIDQEKHMVTIKDSPRPVKENQLLPIASKASKHQRFGLDSIKAPKVLVTSRDSPRPVEENQLLPIASIASKHMVTTKDSPRPVEENQLLPIASIASKYMVTTKDSPRPVEENQLLPIASIASKLTQKLSPCAKKVKISLPMVSAKMIGLAQRPITKKPELPVSLSPYEASTTKEKPAPKSTTDRNVVKGKVNGLKTVWCVPSQRVEAANVATCNDTVKAKTCEQIEPSLGTRERKRKVESSTITIPGGNGCSRTVVARKTPNVVVHYLLHGCNHLIEQFLAALERMLTKTEIDGALGLKDGHRCYCCIICYYCSYDLFRLGEHFQLQHRITDLTISLVHPDHAGLQTSIVLMLPTGMATELKVAKMEELIRAEMQDVQPRYQEGEDRPIDKTEQQKTEAQVDENDTAKIMCYSSAQNDVKVLPEICSVGRDELTQKQSDYQTHISTIDVNHNSLFLCPHCGTSINCAESVATILSHVNSHQEFLFDTIKTLADQTAAQHKNANGESSGTESDRYFVCFLCCYSTDELGNMIQHIGNEHLFESKLEYCFVRPRLKHQRKRILLAYPINLSGPLKLARIRELINFMQCNANNVLDNSTTLETTIPANVVDQPNCGQLYKCGFCLDHTAKSRLQLLIHLDTKCMFKGIDYPCAHCDEMLDCRAAKSNDFNADIIFEHLYYHGENLYRCSVCGIIHYKRRVIKKHLLREHHQHDGVVAVRESSVWWDCSLCELRTRYRQTIMEHMMTKHKLPGERYMCGHCRDSDYDTQYFKIHMASSHSEVTVDKLQIIEMYTSVAVANDDANTSSTTGTNVVKVETQQSSMEPMEVSSIPTESTESSKGRTEISEEIERECVSSSASLSPAGSVAQETISATTTSVSEDRSLSNSLNEAPSKQESSFLSTADNPKTEITDVVEDPEIPLLVNKEDIGILKSILPEGTPLIKTKFGVRLRLDSPIKETSEKLADDFTLKDIKTEEVMEHLPRTDNAMMVEISSEKQLTPRGTSRRSTRVAMQKDATQQWSNCRVFACYFCKRQYNCFDSLKSHVRAKHAEQELLSYVEGEENLKCVFQLLPLFRCAYCMGSTVGTLDQLLAHCKEEHTGKTFACVDFWNVFKCGFCPYLNGSGIHKEIQDHFMATHSSGANIINSCDYVDSDFLAWALAFGATQDGDGSVKKPELVRYICNRCGAHADDEESLGEHMAYHLFHFACQHCSSAFKELKALYEHATTMHAQTDINVPRMFNTVPQHQQLFDTLVMFSNGLIMTKRELLTTAFLSYVRHLNKGIQSSYRRQLDDLAQYKSDLQLPLETPSDDESEGETCATFVKKQLFYPALIISPADHFTEAKYDTEFHAKVKSEQVNVQIGTERSDTKGVRRSSRF
ncbi:uncharacterized protein LOC126577784 [Anopheles aquasalis]|uniref:uncharacterized protein LOC126577784 n=1 Tax=Anopheles aquasalis TaxID=42839 RepID=UPI00215B50A6|nr:uncharacterized protein LOC126577784 [Anopheles aquasalis]